MNKIIFIFFIVAVSCKTTDSVNRTRTVELMLIDSSIKLKQIIPPNFDTNYRWVKYGDNGRSSDYHKFRFSSKTTPSTKQDEDTWDFKQESFFYYTIKYPNYFPNTSTLSSTADGVLAWKSRKLIESKFDPFRLTITLDTIENINKKYFSIIIMSDTTMGFKKSVLATTIIKGVPISFIYDLRIKNRDSFMIFDKYISESIHSIELIDEN